MNIDVIAITYGEPSTNSFGEQWRYSNRILSKLTRLVAPIPAIAVPFIGAWRGYTRTKLWTAEKFSSPLQSISRRQVECIQNALHERNDGHAWRVHLAYEFQDPSLFAVLDRIRQQNSERVVLLPMYLATSDFTSGISLRDYETYQTKNRHPFPNARLVTIRAYHLEVGRLLADFIRRQIRIGGIDSNLCLKTGLLLGCHGTLVKPPPGIADTGYCDTKQVYDDVEKELKEEFKAVAIGWLNHRLGGEWTSPTLEASVQTMLQEGIEQFVYFPFGFWADNAETQLEGRSVFHKLGVRDYHHLPCINDDADFIQFLTQRIVIESLK